MFCTTAMHDESMRPLLLFTLMKFMAPIIIPAVASAHCYGCALARETEIASAKSGAGMDHGKFTMGHCKLSTRNNTKHILTNKYNHT